LRENVKVSLTAFFLLTLALSLVAALSPSIPIVLEAGAISVPLPSSAYDINPHKVIGHFGLALCVAILGSANDTYYCEINTTNITLDFLVDHDWIFGSDHVQIRIGWYGYCLDGRKNVTFTPSSQQIMYHYYPNGGRSVTEKNTLNIDNMNQGTHNITVYAQLASHYSPGYDYDFGLIAASSNLLNFTVKVKTSPTPSASPTPTTLPPTTLTPTLTPTATPTQTPTATPSTLPQTPSPMASPTSSLKITDQPAPSPNPDQPETFPTILILSGVVATTLVGVSVAVYIKRRATKRSPEQA
jgi:hypothetical protein